LQPTPSEPVPDLADGTPIGDGLVVSRKGGFNVVVYRCECGRENPAYCPPWPRGVQPQIVELIGWRRITDRWVCPHCTGNLENLRRVFESADPIPPEDE